MHVFWPKTEKEHQLNITTLIQLFWTSVTNIIPIHLPDEERHHPDTLRHPPDTPKFSTFWPRLVTGRKGNSLIWRLLFNCLWFIWHLYSPRHLPPQDMIQTPSDTHRHPQTPTDTVLTPPGPRYRRFYVLALEEKAISELAWLLHILTNKFGINTSPDTIRPHPDTPRHNSDTPRHRHFMQ